MAHRGHRIVAGLVAALVALTAGCGAPAGDRERDTAAEARRDRIAAVRAENPIGMVGDEELDVLDTFLQWRAEWDGASADAFAALERRRSGDAAAAAVDAALAELEDEVADLGAIDLDGVDGAVAAWIGEIAAGYDEQAGAIAALADAEVDGDDPAGAQAEVVAAYERTLAVELRLLREVADWLNEDAPAARDRLTEIADAIERETESSG